MPTPAFLSLTWTSELSPVDVVRPSEDDWWADELRRRWNLAFVYVSLRCSVGVGVQRWGIVSLGWVLGLCPWDVVSLLSCADQKS